MKNYQITKKFKFWAAPIVDRAYGSITPQDVLDFLNETNLADFFNESKPKKKLAPKAPIPVNEHYEKRLQEYDKYLKKYEIEFKKYEKRKRTSLASEVIPIIEKGHQPIGDTGPSDSYKTHNHNWESSTVEYQRLRRGLFGMPLDKLDPIEKPSVTTIVKEALLQ